MLAAIDWLMLLVGAAVASFAVFTARPWHNPDEWRGAPFEVRAFMWFALAVVVAEFVVLGALSDLRDSWNPYLGRGQMHVYVFGGPAAMALCRSRVLRLRLILVGFIGLWVALSLLRFWSHPQRPGETDPSRMVNPYQLVWTVGIPLLWAAVLCSPRVKRYCAQGPAVLAS